MTEDVYYCFRVADDRWYLIGQLDYNNVNILQSNM